jgi:hypothetical protein
MRAPALLAGLLWAAAAAAQGTPPAAHVAALIAAIEAAGCEVNEANNRDILRAAGLSEDEGAAVVMLLTEDGRAATAEGALRLKTGVCE